MTDQVTPLRDSLPDLAAALEDLFVRGTPENTLRAYERDLAYISVWKQAAFGTPLDWPEGEAVALRFVLDHARDLSGVEREDPTRRVAEELIAQGLRRALKAPAPATVDLASFIARACGKPCASPAAASVSIR